MTLRFSYHHFPTRHPVIALGGQMTRPKPLVRITLLGPGGSYLEDGLLDTGADDTVFPASAATRIGLDLTNAPAGQASGVGGHPAVRLLYAEVRLRLTDGVEFLEWPAWVGFTRDPLRRPLLGYAGVLQFFSATFHGDRQEVELTTNATYPVTP